MRRVVMFRSGDDANMNAENGRCEGFRHSL